MFLVVVKPRLEQMSPRVEETAPPVVAESPKPVESPSVAVVEASPSPVVDTFVPPADAKMLANSKDQLDGKLAEQYVDFYFYYPGSWQSDPKLA